MRAAGSAARRSVPRPGHSRRRSRLSPPRPRTGQILALRAARRPEGRPTAATRAGPAPPAATTDGCWRRDACRRLIRPVAGRPAAGETARLGAGRPDCSAGTSDWSATPGRSAGTAHGPDSARLGRSAEPVGARRSPLQRARGRRVAERIPAAHRTVRLVGRGSGLVGRRVRAQHRIAGLLHRTVRLVGRGSGADPRRRVRAQHRIAGMLRRAVRLLGRVARLAGRGAEFPGAGHPAGSLGPPASLALTPGLARRPCSTAPSRPAARYRAGAAQAIRSDRRAPDTGVGILVENRGEPRRFSRLDAEHHPRLAPRLLH